MYQDKTGSFYTPVRKRTQHDVGRVGGGARGWGAIPLAASARGCKIASARGCKVASARGCKVASARGCKVRVASTRGCKVASARGCKVPLHVVAIGWWWRKGTVWKPLHVVAR